MTITRDVVNDLLPLYVAGDASADTRALVEEYLRDHPDFADEVRASAARATALLGAVSAPPARDLETITLERARRFDHIRATILGFAGFLTLMPFRFSFDRAGVHFPLAVEPAWTWPVMWAVAAAFWLVYYAMGRRGARVMQ